MQNETNVVNLFQANPVAEAVSSEKHMFLDEIRDQGGDYVVGEADNLFPSVCPETNLVDYIPTGKKTIVNLTTNEAMGVMSEGYPVIQPLDIYSAVNREISKIDELDCTGAYCHTDIANGGANMAVRYIFPAHSVDIGGGDTTSLMITAINSYNGTSGLCIYLGGFRGYCMNTQVFGTTIVSYRKKHTKSLNIDDAAQIIRCGIEVFLKEGEAWKIMKKTQVSVQDAYVALADLAEISISKHPTVESYLQEQIRNGKTRTTKIENYLRIFNKYCREMGSNEFALYNTLTHIATHGAAKAGNRPQAISSYDTRQKNITRVAQKHITAYAEVA